jgi:predicted membrane-bound spermidine synthase
LLSTTSPILIALLTSDAKSSGANSGKIYAVSTLGGIVATFMCGFYFIPTYGVTNTLYFFSIILSWSLLLLLEKKKDKLFYLISISLFSLFIFFYKKSPTHSFVKYSSDGMLGKIEVIDKRIDSINTIRLLLVNHIVQSEQNLKTKRSTSEYIHIIEKNIDSLPNKKALVLGLGAGLSANMLIKKNYKTTAIELDDRIIQASKTYFNLDATVKTICNDARVYINQCHEKYDLIMFDIYKAEEQPSHVISKESLQKLKLMLYKNALIVINTHGYLNGTIGLGTQCLLATLKQAGFNLKICTASTDPNYRNLIIFATEKPITHKLLDEINFSITDSLLINTDDKPVLEKLNAEASKTWRLHYIKNSTYIH